MSFRNRQSGVSILGVLIILALVSFFLSVSIRLLPAWLEGRELRQALQRVVEASSPSDSLTDVNRRIQSTFSTNRIEAVRARDVKVYRDQGVIIIEANYEKRTPLFENVDAVLMFNNNSFSIE